VFGLPGGQGWRLGRQVGHEIGGLNAPPLAVEGHRVEHRQALGVQFVGQVAIPEDASGLGARLGQRAWQGQAEAPEGSAVIPLPAGLAVAFGPQPLGEPRGEARFPVAYRLMGEDKGPLQGLTANRYPADRAVPPFTTRGGYRPTDEQSVVTVFRRRRPHPGYPGLGLTGRTMC